MEETGQHLEELCNRGGAAKVIKINDHMERSSQVACCEKE